MSSSTNNINSLLNTVQQIRSEIELLKTQLLQLKLNNDFIKSLQSASIHTIALKNAVKSTGDKMSSLSVDNNLISNIETATRSMENLSQQTQQTRKGMGRLGMKNKTSIKVGVKTENTSNAAPIAVNAVDKTKGTFDAIKGKMKLLSSPISFIAKNFIKPALADEKDTSSVDAAKQIKRVNASIEGMKSSLGKVFMPIISGVLRPVADWLEKYQPRIDKFIQGISGKVKMVMNVIEPVIGNFFVKLSKVIEKLLPLFTKVFKAIPNIIQGMQPVLEKVFSFIISAIEKLPPIFNVIIDVVKFLGKAWKDLWPTISSLLETAWGIIEPIFSIFKSLAQIIVDIFVAAWPGISKAVQGVWEFIKPILDLIGDALGGIAKVASWVAGAVGGLLGGGGSAKGSKSSGPSGKANAFGLSRVPYDNYPALLHEGERVLTKQEVNSSSRSGGVSIAKLADTIVVREEADIDRISNALVNKLQSAAFNMA